MKSGEFTRYDAYIITAVACFCTGHWIAGCAALALLVAVL